MYQIQIKNRDYSEWSFEPNDEILSTVKPIDCRVFSGDSFVFDEKKQIVIKNSPVRSVSHIPAVLVLKGNKTYGRNNGPKGKLLYKCIPDDIRIPSFLVPYEIKNIGFSKVFSNMYITFQFKEWVDKHPTGVIQQVIGSVDELDAFYEYQIYCKNLNFSLQKFNKDTSKALEKYSHQGFVEKVKSNYPNISDRTDRNVFTIDPENSKDFDDAFSIQEMYGDKTLVSIYIANVVLWMEILDLWNSFSERVSTIYLPNQKRSMLPMILSDSICSLTEKTNRLAFTMDIIIDNLTCEIIEVKYVNSIIHVSKNFVYEESPLLHYGDYIWLKELTLDLCNKYKYLPSVKDSHEVVAYWMTLMNHYCSVSLMKKKTGIFRSFLKKELESPAKTDIPLDVSNFIQIWSSHSSGSYLLYKEEQDISHDMLGLQSYVHTTSPIRRLVDLLNMIQMIKESTLLSEKANQFYEKWIQKIDFINVNMKSIRRVQTDCQLLYLCTTNPIVLTKEYPMYLIEERSEDNEFYEYTVYLPELKLVTHIKTTVQKSLFKEEKGKLYLFEDEARMRKKIRLQII